MLASELLQCWLNSLLRPRDHLTMENLGLQIDTQQGYAELSLHGKTIRDPFAIIYVLYRHREELTIAQCTTEEQVAVMQRFPLIFLKLIQQQQIMEPGWGFSRTALRLMQQHPDFYREEYQETIAYIRNMGLWYNECSMFIP